MTFYYRGFKLDAKIIPGCGRTYDSPAEPPEVVVTEGWRLGRNAIPRQLSQARLDKVLNFGGRDIDEAAFDENRGAILRAEADYWDRRIGERWEKATVSA